MAGRLSLGAPAAPDRLALTLAVHRRLALSPGCLRKRAVLRAATGARPQPGRPTGDGRTRRYDRAEADAVSASDLHRSGQLPERAVSGDALSSVGEGASAGLPDRDEGLVRVIHHVAAD